MLGYVSGNQNDIIERLEDLFKLAKLEYLWDWLLEQEIVTHYSNQFQIYFETEEEHNEAMDKVWKRIEADYLAGVYVP